MKVDARQAQPRPDEPAIGPILVVFSGVVVTVIVVFAGTWMLFRWWSRADADRDAMRIPQEEARGVYDGPRLQTSPEVELKEWQRREEEELNRYGWVDRERGIVRMPVERAMDLVVERGIPVWGEANSSVTPLELRQRSEAEMK